MVVKWTLETLKIGSRELFSVITAAGYKGHITKKNQPIGITELGQFVPGKKDLQIKTSQKLIIVNPSSCDDFQ